MQESHAAPDPVRSGAEVYLERLAYNDYKEGRIALSDAVPFCYRAPDGAVEFNFHQGQASVMQCSARFIIALAARQSGKSECGAPWMFDETRTRGPGWHMIVAPSFPLLEDSALPKFLDLFENKLQLGKMRSKPLSFILSKAGERFIYSGTRWANQDDIPPTIYRFGHGASAASLEAKTALSCWIDEGGQSEFKAESFEAIEGRLTTTRGRCLISTTPYALNWLYRRFYLPWLEGRGKELGIEVVNWPSYFNPAFPRSEYDRLKLTMPPWRFDMFYNGIFTRPAGLIYDVFEESRHLCKPFVIPDSWERFIGMDFGGSNTCWVLVARDPGDGMLYLYDCQLAGNRTPEEHYSYITRPTRWSHDNSFFDRAAGGSAAEGNWRDLYRDAGLWIEDPRVKGHGSVESRIDFTYALLARNGLRIFSDQEGIITEFNTYSREIDPETGETIPGTIRNQNDYHRLDALAYLVAQLGAAGGYVPDMVAGDRLEQDRPRYIVTVEEEKPGPYDVVAGDAPRRSVLQDFDSCSSSLLSPLILPRLMPPSRMFG